MFGFKKRKRKVAGEDAGRLLLRVAGEAAENGYGVFLERLDLSPAEVGETEFIVAYAFMLVPVVENRFPAEQAISILEGARKDFVETMVRSGLPEAHANGFWVQRLTEYSDSLKNSAGAGPMWHLGSRFFVNATESDEPSATGGLLLAELLAAFSELARRTLDTFEISK